MMRKPALILFWVLVACGGDSGGDDATTPDGGGDGDGSQTVSCDPALQTGCSANTACYSDLYLSPAGDPAYYCAAPGAGTQGTNCAADTDCAAGFWCLKYTNPNNGMMAQTCSAYCRTQAPSHSCPGAELCIETAGYPFGYCFR